MLAITLSTTACARSTPWARTIATAAALSAFSTSESALGARAAGAGAAFLGAAFFAALGADFAALAGFAGFAAGAGAGAAAFAAFPPLAAFFDAFPVPFFTTDPSSASSYLERTW